MKIDNSIAKMEEALEKKKALRASKNKAKLVTLESRIKVKAEKITKLQDDLANTVTEMKTVKARIQKEGEVVDAEMPDCKAATSLVTDEGIKAVNDAKPTDETKTKAFGPDKPGSSSDRKTATRKK